MLSGLALSRFRKNLLAWFTRFRRDLPWRRTNDPYRIWLSEIMLQQTRVNAVIPYYEKFLARFPDMQSLAEAPEEEVQGPSPAWRRLTKCTSQITLHREAPRPAPEFAG